jgi:hypothetical protein
VIKSVKLNDEPIHVFDYNWYIYDHEDGDYDLNLELIITEIVAGKFNFEDKVNVSLRYDNEEEQNLLMSVDSVIEVGHPEIPTIDFSGPIDDPKEFEGLRIVKWKTSYEEYRFHKEDITIEEIRKVEMPNRDVNINLNLNLPIDLQEWVEQNEGKVKEIIEESLYNFWKTKASE